MEPNDEDFDQYDYYPLDDEDYLEFMTSNNRIYYDDNTKEDYQLEEDE